MTPSRRERPPRRGTYARVLYGSGENPGYLRDLSTDGCRISFVEPVEVPEGSDLAVQVVPDLAVGIEAFRVTLKIKWIRQESVFCSVGAEVSRFPTGEDQVRFGELLA